MAAILEEKQTVAEKIIGFNNSLDYSGMLPDGISIMNPIRENPDIKEASAQFYRKYYSDFSPRYVILGINPGRLGGGLTGVPFTDPKRLSLECDIPYKGAVTHEPSSALVYEMIKKYGGIVDFYKKFYFGAVCPLGFKSVSKRGKEVNFNYYDSKELISGMYDFIVSNLEKQVKIGLRTDICFCLGTGKNFQFLSTLNKKYKFFGQVVQLEHPRYIMQYKLKRKDFYLDKYLESFKGL